jgi:hypothetical protein
MFDRLDIENSILGAIIYHNAYTQVSHILAPSNFSSLPAIDNRGLYKVISGLFPERPIDLLTIGYEIRTKFPQDVTLMSTLLNTGHKITSAASASYWALVLLQEDITGKFIRQLAEWRAQRESDHNLVEAAALMEVINDMALGGDVLDVIERATLYFHSLNMQTEFDACMQFYDDLSTKVKNIKKMNPINTALNYLYQATEADDVAQEHCRIFADAIASILINQKIDPKFIEAANLITQ